MISNSELCRRNGACYVPESVPPPPRYRRRLVGRQGWIAIALVAAGILIVEIALAVAPRAAAFADWLVSP